MSERRIIKPHVIQLTEADTLIVDALGIIQAEMVKFSHKTRQGKSLDLAEARVLQGYIKSLTELSREARERSKLDDSASKLSDAELVAAIEMLRKKEALKVAAETKDEDDRD